MSTLRDKLAAMSPDQRELLELLLRKEGLELKESMILPQSRESNAFPLSYAQKRLWFLDQLAPGNAAYNIPLAVRVHGPLDVPLLIRSVEEIARRHESLRTTFSNVSGTPVQVVTPEPVLYPIVVDLRNLGTGVMHEEVQRLISGEATHPFNLSRGPLVRLTVARTGETEYTIVLTMPHIVSDGWSLTIIFQELSAIYEAWKTGKYPPLKNLPIHYVDYACWQEGRFAAGALEKDLRFWKDQLADLPPLLELPYDHPRPATQSYRGSRYKFQLPSDTTAELRSLCTREGVTMFMTLLAAFQTLLSRYTGTSDIPIGTPIANRTRPELEGLIGFFVNTLVMRTRIDRGVTFTQILRQVRKVAVDAFDHQEIPFEVLVETLRPVRDPSYTPLFQVMFSSTSDGIASRQLADLLLEPIPVENDTSKFDLSLLMTERRNGTDAVVEFNRDLFDEGTIVRMATHFCHLLGEVIRQPEVPLNRISLLTPADTRRILVEWNTTDAEFPQGQTLPQLFEAQVQRTPDVPAVTDETSSLSYRELYHRASRLASILRRYGVCPEVPVGITMERRVDAIVAMMGIQMAGGPFVPLDPAQPPSRLRRMMGDAKVSIIVTHTKHREFLLTVQDDTTPVTCVCLDADTEQVTHDGVEPLTERASAENLAYILYTSGSTGVPKGVSCRHAGVVNLLAQFERLGAIPVGETSSWWSSLSFDASIYEIYSSLTTGGTLCIVPEQIRPDGIKYFEWMQEHRIASTYVPPFMIGDFVAWLEKSGRGMRLRRLFVGVEPIHEHILAAIRDHIPSLKIINAYGPTETTVCCTLFPMGDQPPQNRNTPIGRAVCNTKIYILDDQLQPVPIGVHGELYAGGVGLARGYSGRPDLTAERFLPDPFDSVGGQRVYKTGDIARFLPDGNIEFIGRKDFQVKVRGYRIELGEIEAVFSKHPAVRRCHATVWDREDASDQSRGDRVVVAYIVAQADSPVTPEQLKQFAREHLPEYMIPAAVVLLDAFPLTSSGKIDRKSLPTPDLVSDEQEFVPPRTVHEELVATLWADVLKRNAVGVYDNFFELGGHSLLATQLLSRVKSTFGVQVPVRTLFEAPTLAEFAAHVEREQTHGRKAAVPPIVASERHDPIPLSFAQQRLWFLEQLEPGSSRYNIPSAYRLRGKLSLGALEMSITEIVRRHEILRTTFPSVDGKPFQLIASPCGVAVQILDLSAMPEDRREGEAYEVIRTEAVEPFDLVHGPLFRVVLIRLGEEDHVLVVVMHHIITDGWSLGVFTRELSTLYNAAVTDTIPTLENLSLQYADVAMWQRQWLRDEVLDEELESWRSRLGGTQGILSLPTDHPRPAEQSSRGDMCEFTVDGDVLQALKRVGRQEGVTPFMLLLTAFTILLRRYSRQDDILVGVPVANRNQLEIEPLIGFFVNTLVLRTDCSGNPTIRELLGRVRDTVLFAHAHQDVPFEKIVDAVQPERDMSHAPLFQVMFSFLGDGDAPASFTGLSVESLPLRSETAKFDLSMFITEGGGSLQAALEYSTDLFERPTIERLAAHFRILLEGILENLDHPMGSVPIISPEERVQLIGGWNSTSLDFPRGEKIQDLFEEQVAISPHAPAIVFESEQLTYIELDERANQIAHYLQRLGVEPDMPVAVFLERSLDMVVCMLGILKSGGAYVPMDPGYPAERVSHILEDSGTRIVLTQEAIASRLPADSTTHVAVDTLREVIAQESRRRPDNRATEQNLGYILFTSGSTGRPKGVAIEHRSAVTMIRWAQQVFTPEELSGVLLSTSICFDLSVFELFVPLSVGGAVILVQNALELPSAPAASKVTLVNTVPSAMAELVRSDGLPASAQVVNLAGEALAASLVEKIYAGGKAKKVYNLYGPTEDTTYSTFARVDRNAKVTIGRPIANSQTLVLDEFGEPQPIGVPGELYMTGDGVARGYVSRPELTAERFVPNPFSHLPGARMYRTGDLVRYLPSGDLEYLGRLDHQVKLRGFRIELGEIESALNALPPIQSCVVVVKEDSQKRKRLVGYVVLHSGVTWNLSEVKDALQKTLPDYMVPPVFIVLPELPLTPNGKVNRSALPDPDIEMLHAEKTYEEPHTSLERHLAEIWAQLLGIENVSTTDNFFERGGDSILSIQMIARARQAGIVFTPRDVFQSRTLAELARLAKTATRVSAEQGLVLGEVPLTPIQHWFFSQQFRDPQHWNQSLFFEVIHPLRRDALDEAVRVVIRHHDALRMRYETDDGRILQVNAADQAEGALSWIDLSHVRLDDRHAALTTAAEEQQRSLRLNDGLLLRCAYFSLGSGSTDRLLIVVHHLVMDGVSWRILLEDLQSAYNQAVQKSEVVLPPKTTSFQAWARRIQEFAQREEIRRDADYWIDELSDEFPRVPVDFTEGENSEASAAHVQCALTEAETHALLRVIPATYQVGVDEMLVSALVEAWGRWTGSRVLLMDLEGHGREDLFLDVDLSRTIGWFTSACPVRLDLRAVHEPREVVNAVKDKLRSIPHHGMSFGLLRYLAEDTVRSDLAAKPGPEVSFNYLGQLGGGAGEQGLFVPAKEPRGHEHSPHQKRTYLLDITGGVFDGRLRVEWTYSKHRHRESSIEALAEDFAEALRFLLRRTHDQSDREYTPSDFGMVHLDRGSLEKILQKVQRT